MSFLYSKIGLLSLSLFPVSVLSKNCPYDSKTLGSNLAALAMSLRAFAKASLKSVFCCVVAEGDSANTCSFATLPNVAASVDIVEMLPCRFSAFFPCFAAPSLRASLYAASLSRIDCCASSAFLAFLSIFASAALRLTSF